MANGDAVTLAKFGRRRDHRAGSKPTWLASSRRPISSSSARSGEAPTSLHAYLSAHSQVRTPATKEAAFPDRPLRARSRLVPGPVSGLAFSRRDHRGSHALRAFPPLGPAAASSRGAGRQADRIAPPSGRPRLLPLPAGVRARVRTARLRRCPRRRSGTAGRGGSENPSRPRLRQRSAQALQLPRPRRLRATTGALVRPLPTRAVLVLRSEDFFDQPARTFAAVASFLRIAPDFDAAFATHNESVGPPLEPALRARLSQHFSTKIVALGELLGRHPGWV